ncbi:type II secretion system protein J [Paraglaciecola sp. 2405UD69-4]|uniref:PulJ/GspJ family protein n=1 Tax=Paraglaciecola sp. 2405UD69-4 TaxID=3391836 RepID=UPI0039C93BE7
MKSKLLKNKGFTLIELITVIIVLGIVSVGLSSFIRTGLGIYTDAKEREQVLTESRFVVERLNREIRGAIPNSIRVATNSSNSIQCIEFVPAAWVSFYTTLPVLPDSASTMKTVEVANNPENYTFSIGDFAVVYPTMDADDADDNDFNDSADVYDLSRNKRKAILSCDNGNGEACNISDGTEFTSEFTVSGAFADYSPASRVYFVNHAISYCAHSNGNIYRIQDTINPSQTIYNSGVLMAENLKNDFNNANERPFTIYAATLSRNSLVQLLLTFENNEEVINYSNEVHIPNVP